MAKRINIEVDCDPHKAQNETVPGTQEEIWDAEAKKVRYLDMCDSCRTLGYDEVLALSRQLGVFDVPSPNGGQKVTPRKSASKEPRDAVCPVCGLDGLSGRADNPQSRGVVQHARSKHPVEYARWQQTGEWPSK